MVKINIESGETIEQALRRFNRIIQEEGIIDEVKERQFYIKPSVTRRLKDKEKLAKIKRDKRYNR
ncbi:30S ribosomal protein S21 [Candidatus Parcubacteria bacterium]|nr:30S ribosomal protein S21 [Patescibacteria group bacterium]MCG2689029.1 30S ribosomal protein S21 [Candidatus Parcubacteria bacterium]